MTMDISDTLAPDSDQLDAVDLATGPRIFTVKSVSKGDAEQPVQVHLVEFPRGPWRPGKNMRRVLAACWGVDASAWAGRRVELYCDPAVRFGADLVGGTRIAKLSHIDKQQKIPLLISRGKSGTYTVNPLPNAPAPTLDDDPVTTPFVADGKLGDALSALSQHQRVELLTECGITMKDGKVDPPMKLAELRDKLWQKWAELHLPDDQEGEPVPVSILGAIYAKRAADSPSDAAEAFGIFAETGQDLDLDPQTVMAGEHKKGSR